MQKPVCDIRKSRYLGLIQAAIDKGKRPDISEACVYDTAISHSQVNGSNYEWLAPYYGRVLWIDFEEPVGSGNWRT